MNEKVEVQIGNRRLVVEMEGWTPMEINALSQKVSERLIQMQSHNTGVADTSKIALLAALSFAAELDRERQAHDLTRRLLENKAESLSESLRDSLKMSSDTDG